MKLTVTRFNPEKEKDPHEETYEVPEYEGMTVLDALIWIREHKDPSLSHRYSCRNANACKECIAMVDGKAAYTCTVPAVGEMSVKPLVKKKVFRDLSTELF